MTTGGAGRLSVLTRDFAFMLALLFILRTIFKGIEVVTGPGVGVWNEEIFKDNSCTEQKVARN